MNHVNNYPFINDIADGMVEFYENMPLDQIGQQFDYAGRFCGHTFFILSNLAAASLQYWVIPNFSSLIAGEALLIMTTVAVAGCVDKIFDMLEIEPSKSRTIARGAIALLTGSALSAAAVVGLGMFPSITAIFLRIYPGVCTVALTSLLALAIEKIASVIFESLGIPAYYILNNTALCFLSGGCVGGGAIWLAGRIGLRIGLYETADKNFGLDAIGAIILQVGIYHSLRRAFDDAIYLKENGPQPWAHLRERVKSLAISSPYLGLCYLSGLRFRGLN